MFNSVEITSHKFMSEKIKIGDSFTENHGCKALFHHSVTSNQHFKA